MVGLAFDYPRRALLVLVVVGALAGVVLGEVGTRWRYRASTGSPPT